MIPQSIIWVPCTTFGTNWPQFKALFFSCSNGRKGRNQLAPTILERWTEEIMDSSQGRKQLLEENSIQTNFK